MPLSAKLTRFTRPLLRPRILRLPRIPQLLRLRPGKLALAAAAALTVPLITAAPPASAGDVSFSVKFGDKHKIGFGRHHDRSHRHRYRHHDRDRGYHQRVWVPPVYETRYRRCGTPYRVCVSRGYYKQVYVSHHLDRGGWGHWRQSRRCGW
ncbi:MAG: hypothetical protein AAFX76_04940 [Planctomycetota bacterium]